MENKGPRLHSGYCVTYTRVTALHSGVSFGHATLPSLTVGLLRYMVALCLAMPPGSSYLSLFGDIRADCGMWQDFMLRSDGQALEC